MKDMDGLHFAMIAVSVNAPFAITAVVADVRVNHARSWPRYGDVSWQPACARSTEQLRRVDSKAELIKIRNETTLWVPRTQISVIGKHLPTGLCVR